MAARAAADLAPAFGRAGSDFPMVVELFTGAMFLPFSVFCLGPKELLKCWTCTDV